MIVGRTMTGRKDFVLWYLRQFGVKRLRRENECSHTRSFLNSKFGMPLVHLKIEQYRISRPRPFDGSDLVLTEWTPHRKSTHKMENQSWVWRFPEGFCPLWSACGAPMPCGAGSSINQSVWKRRWLDDCILHDVHTIKFYVMHKHFSIFINHLISRHHLKYEEFDNFINVFSILCVKVSTLK